MTGRGPSVASCGSRRWPGTADAFYQAMRTAMARRPSTADQAQGPGRDALREFRHLGLRQDRTGAAASESAPAAPARHGLYPLWRWGAAPKGCRTPAPRVARVIPSSGTTDIAAGLRTRPTDPAYGPGLRTRPTDRTHVMRLRRARSRPPRPGRAARPPPANSRLPTASPHTAAGADADVCEMPQSDATSPDLSMSCRSAVSWWRLGDWSLRIHGRDRHTIEPARKVIVRGGRGGTT